MDNFRRPKRPSSGANLEGFVGPRQASMNGNFRRTQSYRPVQSQSSAPQQPQVAQPVGGRQPQVGDFRRPEGFRPASRPVMATPVSSNSTSVGQALPSPQLPLTMPGKQSRRAAKRAAKKSKIKQPRSWRKILKRTFLMLLVLVLLTGGYLAFTAYQKTRKVLKGGGSAAALTKDVDPSLLKGEGDGRVNIMVLGKGGPGHEAPDLTDTLMIASIDPVHKDAALLSIPRDLWVKVPGNGSMKINAVYATEKSKVLAKRRYDGQQKDAEKAGLDAIERTLESTLGVPIHYYSMVDFEAFRKAIDTVGGVDINVKERLYDPTVAWENNWNPLIASVGPNHFNGKKALLYARSRQTSARGDFDRAVRQREIIVALKDKVLSLGTFGNPVKINELINAFGDRVQTNFSPDEIKRLYDLAKEIPSSKVVSVGLADPPQVLVTTGTINGQSVVLPKAGAGNYAAIQSFVRNALKDSYIKNENASIAVLNGTTVTGLATRRADELKSFGYNVVQVGDSPVKGNATTLLVDMRNGTKRYTKHYLEQRLNVSATSRLPEGVNPGTADFVIILGQNESNASE